MKRIPQGGLTLLISMVVTFGATIYTVHNFTEKPAPTQTVKTVGNPVTPESTELPSQIPVTPTPTLTAEVAQPGVEESSSPSALPSRTFMTELPPEEPTPIPGSITPAPPETTEPSPEPTSENGNDPGYTPPPPSAGDDAPPGKLTAPVQPLPPTLPPLHPKENEVDSNTETG